MSDIVVSEVCNTGEGKQKDIESDEVEIKSGDYWREKETGLIRLLRSLTVIDGILHSVSVLQHPTKQSGFDNNGRPSWTASPDDLTVDEFLDAFEPLDQIKAKEELDAEISKLQEEINEASRLLANGYEDEDGVGANNLLTGMSNQIRSDMSLPVSMAKDNTVSLVKDNIEKTKKIVEKQREHIDKHKSVISQKTHEISAYYSQVAEQSLASIDGTMVFIEKLQQGVHTLDIFLGKGVNTYTLSVGKPAPDEEKLTFYQRKLFLDEEWFYNLANGGADHSDLGAFKESLKDDFSIIDRIAPNPKSVVLMQFRRNPKQRQSDFVPTFSNVFEAIREDQLNREVFLLVRNGENVTLVFSEDIQGGERLFPTSREINALFKDRQNEAVMFDGAEIDNYIDFKDIRNAKARQEFDRKALYYKRVILMLNGLYEREPEVFGQICKNGYSDWLSLEFQRKCFNFVYDDEDALEYSFMSLSQFQEEKNRYVQAGSRIVGIWSKIADEDNASGMWSKPVHYESQQYWYPEDTVEPLIVEKDKKGIFVRVLCRHRYNEYNPKKFKVYLSKNELASYTLCLDNITADEVEFYLESRRARTHYVRFARLLISVRDALRAEEEEAKPHIDALIEHVSSIYSDIDSGELVEDLKECIILWRIKNKWKPLPDLLSPKEKKSLKYVSDLLHKKIEYGRRGKLKEFAISEGVLTEESFIRCSLDQKGNLFAYSVVDKNDRVDFGECQNYPFVWKHHVKATSSGKMSLISSRQVVYKEWVMGELNISEGTAYEADTELSLMDEDVLSSILEIDAQAKEADAIITMLSKDKKDEADAFLRKYFDDRIAVQKKSKGRYILPYPVVFVRGVYLVDACKGKDGYYRVGLYDEKTVSVYEWSASIDMLIAVYGSNALFEDVLSWVMNRYAHPEDAIRVLREARDEALSERGIPLYKLFSSYQTNFPLLKSSLPALRADNGVFVHGNGYRGSKGRNYDGTNSIGMQEKDVSLDAHIERVKRTHEKDGLTLSIKTVDDIFDNNMRKKL